MLQEIDIGREICHISLLNYYYIAKLSVCCGWLSKSFEERWVQIAFSDGEKKIRWNRDTRRHVLAEILHGVKIGLEMTNFMNRKHQRCWLKFDKENTNFCYKKDFPREEKKICRILSSWQWFSVPVIQ
jgi:hypothetical protein